MKPMSKAEQLDQELAGLCLSAERKTAILEAMKGAEPVKKTTRAIHTLMIAAAVCALLTISALALSPTLRDIMTGQMGEFEPYGQAVDGVSVIDQGIQVSVVETIGDENYGYIYLEIKDLTGDRLTEDTYLNSAVPVAFDPETNTLLARTSWWDDPRDEDGNITITLKQIWGGVKFDGIPLPVELLEPDNVLETMVLPEEEGHSINDDRIALVPDQTPMALEGTDLFTLSSMGFDELGRLHVQIKTAEGCTMPDWTFFLNLGEIESLFDSPEFQEKYPNLNLQGSDHLFEDGQYADFYLQPMIVYDWVENIFEYLPKEYFQGQTLTLAGWIGTSECVEGDWTLTFPLEVLPKRTVSIGQMVNRKQVESVDISAMSATFTLTLPEGGGQGDLARLPLTVYLADGSAFTVEQGRCVHSYRDDEYRQEPYYLDRWEFPEPVNPEDVTAVAIHYWCIPLDGRTAQPGYWLSELPGSSPAD